MKYKPQLRQYHSDKEDKRFYHVGASMAGFALLGAGALGLYKKRVSILESLKKGGYGDYVNTMNEHIQDITGRSVGTHLKTLRWHILDAVGQNVGLHPGLPVYDPSLSSPKLKMTPAHKESLALAEQAVAASEQSQLVQINKRIDKLKGRLVKLVPDVTERKKILEFSEDWSHDRFAMSYSTRSATGLDTKLGQRSARAEALENVVNQLHLDTRLENVAAKAPGFVHTRATTAEVITSAKAIMTGVSENYKPQLDDLKLLGVTEIELLSRRSGGRAATKSGIATMDKLLEYYIEGARKLGGSRSVVKSSLSSFSMLHGRLAKTLRKLRNDGLISDYSTTLADQKGAKFLKLNVDLIGGGSSTEFIPLGIMPDVDGLIQFGFKQSPTSPVVSSSALVTGKLRSVGGKATVEATTEAYANFGKVVSALERLPAKQIEGAGQNANFRPLVAKDLEQHVFPYLGRLITKEPTYYDPASALGTYNLNVKLPGAGLDPSDIVTGVRAALKMKMAESSKQLVSVDIETAPIRGKQEVTFISLTAPGKDPLVVYTEHYKNQSGMLKQFTMTGVKVGGPLKEQEEMVGQYVNKVWGGYKSNSELKKLVGDYMESVRSRDSGSPYILVHGGSDSQAAISDIGALREAGIVVDKDKIIDSFHMAKIFEDTPNNLVDSLRRAGVPEQRVRSQVREMLITRIMKDGVTTRKQAQMAARNYMRGINFRQHNALTDSVMTTMTGNALGREIRDMLKMNMPLEQVKTLLEQSDGGLGPALQVLGQFPELARQFPQVYGLATSNQRNAGINPISRFAFGASAAQRRGQPFFIKLDNLFVDAETGKASNRMEHIGHHVNVRHGGKVGAELGARLEPTINGVAVELDGTVVTRPLSKQLPKVMAEETMNVAQHSNLAKASEYEVSQVLVLGHSRYASGAARMHPDLLKSFLPLTDPNGVANHVVRIGADEKSLVNLITSYKAAELGLKNGTGSAQLVATLKDTLAQELRRRSPKAKLSRFERELAHFEIEATESGGYRAVYYTPKQASALSTIDDLNKATHLGAMKDDMEIMRLSTRLHKGLRSLEVGELSLGRGTIGETLVGMAGQTQATAMYSKHPDAAKIVRKLDRVIRTIYPIRENTMESMALAGKATPRNLLTLAKLIERSNKTLGVVYNASDLTALSPNIMEGVHASIVGDAGDEMVSLANYMTNVTEGGGRLFLPATAEGLTRAAVAVTQPQYIRHAADRLRYGAVTQYTGLAETVTSEYDPIRAFAETILGKARQNIELTGIRTGSAGGVKLNVLDKTTELRNIVSKIDKLRELDKQAAGRGGKEIHKQIRALYEELSAGGTLTGLAGVRLGDVVETVPVLSLANMEPGGKLNFTSLGRSVRDVLTTENAGVQAQAGAIGKLRAERLLMIKSARKGLDYAAMPGVTAKATIDNLPGYGPFDILYGKEDLKELRQKLKLRPGDNVNDYILAAGGKQPNVSGQFYGRIVESPRERGISISSSMAAISNIDVDGDDYVLQLLTFNRTNNKKANLLRRAMTGAGEKQYQEQNRQYRDLFAKCKNAAATIDNGKVVQLDDVIDDWFLNAERRRNVDIMSSGLSRLLPFYVGANGDVQMRGPNNELTSFPQQVTLGRYQKVIQQQVHKVQHSSSKFNALYKNMMETMLGGGEGLADNALQQMAIGELYNQSLNPILHAKALHKLGKLDTSDIKNIGGVFAVHEEYIKGLKGNTAQGRQDLGFMGKLYSDDFAGYEANMRTFLSTDGLFLGGAKATDKRVKSLLKLSEELRGLNIGRPSPSQTTQGAIEEMVMTAAKTEETNRMKSVLDATLAMEKGSSWRQRMPKWAVMGAAILGAAYFFKPNQMKMLGEMPGKGGEYWDYKTGGSELPFGAPIDIPQYTWQTDARVSDWGVVSKLNQLGSAVIHRDFTADTHYDYLRQKNAYNRQAEAVQTSDGRKDFKNIQARERVWRDIQSVR